MEVNKNINGNGKIDIKNNIFKLDCIVTALKVKANINREGK